MQDKERLVESFLEVLKEKILKGEDAERVMTQIGQLTNPKLVPCKILPLKPKFQFVDV